jgi:hypothetical protein
LRQFCFDDLRLLESNPVDRQSKTQAFAGLGLLANGDLGEVLIAAIGTAALCL